MAVELATLAALCTGVRAFCAAAGFFGREAVVGLSGGFVSIVGYCRFYRGTVRGCLWGLSLNGLGCYLGFLRVEKLGFSSWGLRVWASCESTKPS